MVNCQQSLISEYDRQTDRQTLSIQYDEDNIVNFLKYQ